MDFSHSEGAIGALSQCEYVQEEDLIKKKKSLQLSSNLNIHKLESREKHRNNLHKSNEV